MELYELEDRVNSKETFLEFVNALAADWAASRAHPSSPYSADARGWENPDLGSFLEQMVAWTVDSGDRVAEQPSWRSFASMLMAAKIYE